MVSPLSTNQNITSSLLHLSRQVIADNIVASDEKTLPEHKINKLPLPNSFKDYIAFSTPILARKIERSCRGSYNSMLNKLLSFLWGTEKVEDDIFKKIVKPVMADMLEQNQGSYAFKHNYIGIPRNENNNELNNHGSLLDIMRYIKHNINSVFSVKVAVILLEFYLDSRPNVITLLFHGYYNLCDFAEDLDELKLTEEQKLASFKGYVSHLTNKHAQKLLISDDLTKENPEQLADRLGIQERNINFLQPDNIADRIFRKRNRSQREITYDQYQVIFNRRINLDTS